MRGRGAEQGQTPLRHQQARSSWISKDQCAVAQGAGEKAPGTPMLSDHALRSCSQLEAFYQGVLRLWPGAMRNTKEESGVYL